MKKLVSALVPLLFLPFASSSQNLEKFEDYVPRASSKLDDTFNKYYKYFATEVETWKRAYLLDSTKSLWCLRNTMEIYDTLPTPTKERSEIVYDSLYAAYGEDRKDKTFVILTGRRGKTKRALERAFSPVNNYLENFVYSLLENDLPTSLAALPFIESGFRNDASSWAGAVGMWQFMPETARRCGLKVTKWKDERKDPEIAIGGTINYFKRAYKKFGEDNHVLALVSYNTGMGNPNFKNHETRNDIAIIMDLNWVPRQYIPSFLAMLKIAKNPCKYDLDIDFNKGLEKHYYIDFRKNSL